MIRTRYFENINGVNQVVKYAPIELSTPVWMTFDIEWSNFIDAMPVSNIVGMDGYSNSHGDYTYRVSASPFGSHRVLVSHLWRFLTERELNHFLMVHNTYYVSGKNHPSNLTKIK